MSLAAHVSGKVVLPGQSYLARHKAELLNGAFPDNKAAEQWFESRIWKDGRKYPTRGNDSATVPVEADELYFGVLEMNKRIDKNLRGKGRYAGKAAVGRRHGPFSRCVKRVYKQSQHLQHGCGGHGELVAEDMANQRAYKNLAKSSNLDWSKNWVRLLPIHEKRWYF